MGKKAEMIMTQFAMMDPGPAGNSLFSRCCRGIAHFFGFGAVPTRKVIHEPLVLSPEPRRPELHIVPDCADAPSPAIELKWRRHEQLRQVASSTLPAEERQARQKAVRGLYAARAGQLDVAEELFTTAARHQDIDLCDIPGFWTLPRNAMMTAVHAYEGAGRLREASALNARIRMQFRPRALTPVPNNVTALPARRAILTGNS